MPDSSAVASSSLLRFPPSLTAKHEDELRRRAISKSFALSSGVRTLVDNEVRELNFQASLPLDQRNHGLQGIGFPYTDLDTKTIIEWRLKPDKPFILGDGHEAKYVSRLGSKIRCYYPHTTASEFKSNLKVNIIITEGEFKALALAERVVPVASRATCVIGLQGVNGGWHRDKVVVPMPDGTKETRREGMPHLIDDLDEWEWSKAAVKRTVYVVFDSDVGSKKNAEEFKRKASSGAWGAEHMLARLLRAKGAEVRVVILPPKLDGTKYGVDDYIAEYGPKETIRLIYNNWVVERSVDEVLYQASRATISIETASHLVASSPVKPTQIIDGILPVGCVAAIGGPAGIGKSFIALNACHAVATGEPFLGMIGANQGKVIYIQTEMPRWALSDRMRGLGELTDNFLVCNPGCAMPLNFWEQDGFNKRRETGQRELVMALLDQIRAHSPALVCFDPLKDFTSSSLSDPEAAKHIMQIFRSIAVSAKCGVLLIHHHKKTGGRESRYEGQDDMFGSYIIQAELDTAISLYSYSRADGTLKYKMVFSKLRHCAQIEPQEIIRYSGSNSFSWVAEKWEDNTSTTAKITDGEKIVRALESGPQNYSNLVKLAGVPKTNFYRAFDALEAKRIVVREGNLYRLVDSEAE